MHGRPPDLGGQVVPCLTQCLDRLWEHGALVEITGIPAPSQIVATGFVVSSVELTSIRCTSSSMITSDGTSTARFGFD